jgi:hypothetical protein
MTDGLHRFCLVYRVSIQILDQDNAHFAARQKRFIAMQME